MSITDSVARMIDFFTESFRLRVALLQYSFVFLEFLIEWIISAEVIESFLTASRHVFHYN